MDSLLFTPASILDLLSKIEELNQYEIGVAETLDEQLQITVGDSVYLIDASHATSVVVDDSVLETVEDANLDAYEHLDDSVDVTVYEDGEQPVESGILKEIAKSLLLGGMIRLSGKLLK